MTDISYNKKSLIYTKKLMPLKISLQNTDLSVSPKQNKTTTKNEAQKKCFPLAG